MRFAPVAAVLVTGASLYVSRGVLDQVVTEGAAVRVALLPPLEALGGFLSLAALGLLALDRRTVPRGTGTAIRASLDLLVLPVLGLAVLLLPYLPFVADAVPAVHMLAGPLRGVIWLVVAMQLLWVLWQLRLVKAEWTARLSLTQLSVGIGIVTAIACGFVASRFAGTVLHPTGDEPHYLVIAQSLWRDGDLEIANNHERRDYSEYYPLALDPHYLTRGADGGIYSIHPVGLPVLAAPVYALGGYRAVVLLIVLMAACAAALMWSAVVRATNAAGATTFAWAAVAVTAPFLFNSFTVYPEIAAALAVVIAFTRATDERAGSMLRPWLPVGLACGALPWLSTKYAPMSAALVAVALARILWPQERDPSSVAGHPSSVVGDSSSVVRRWSSVVRRVSASGERERVGRSAFFDAPFEYSAAGVVLVPYALSLLAWCWFFNRIWGSPWPQAPYGNLVQTHPFNLILGAPGLLFDQEYGLLPYAPVLILTVTGLWTMWRDGGHMRRVAIEIAVVFAALLATVGAFRIWWGGSAPPGRPLVSGLLLLMLPIAVAGRAAAAGSARRAAHHILLWLSIGVAGVMLLAQNGSLTTNGRDGTSSILAYVSPHWPAWTAVPSFIYHEAPTALAHTFAWLLLAAGAALLLRRLDTRHPGIASLAAGAVCAVALLAATLVIPRLPASPAWPGLDVRARSRLPLLDSFDAVARPIGVEYAPLRISGAGHVASRAAFHVQPALRTDPQPTRVLHNGRFSMPAGQYRIEVEWTGARTGDTIGLQIGRTGEPLEVWNVEARAGERWTTEFLLPVDANFVGLRGTPELERVIGRIAIVPLAIVDAARRPRLPQVIGAFATPEGTFYFFDENAFPERPGFWVGGRQTTQVSIHRSQAEGPLKLRLHSGLIGNRLKIATGGWSRTVPLQPKLPEQVEIPVDGRALVTLDLFAEAAFIPKEMDPTSQDARELGIWIEVVP